MATQQRAAGAELWFVTLNAEQASTKRKSAWRRRNSAFRRCDAQTPWIGPAVASQTRGTLHASVRIASAGTPSPASVETD
jgi:hypothetical protein